MKTITVPYQYQANRLLAGWPDQKRENSQGAGTERANAVVTELEALGVPWNCRETPVRQDASSALTIADGLPTSPPPRAAENAFIRRRIQGVDYFCSQPAAGGDLFLTRFGLPFARHLQPENWFAPEWFDDHRQRLRGTSTIYKVATQRWQGEALELIVRYSRVAEALPLDTVTDQRFIHAEFNSPFEEFSIVTQLRAARFGVKERRIYTKRPLAIYAPPDQLALWQTGRSEDKFAVKQARLRDVKLDIQRQYLLVYGWIDGLDAEQAADHLQLSGSVRLRFLRETTETVVGELAEAGFRVLDMKPAHVILRLTPTGALLRRPDGRLVYALVDYELLEQIPTAEKTGPVPR